ncbi:hypothetical protein niasHT_034423 [Heterodera trifolii]|uniref:Ankyrin repeat domain-containing protein n=1 Tax=Heterodera trifolii TaxID=157864 RepID=A0ABD2HSQ3_9BILA
MDQLISGLLGGGGGGGANAGDNQPQQGGGGSGNQLADMAGELIGGFLGGGGGGGGALGGGAGGGDILSTLFNAVKGGDIGSLLGALAGGADVNAKDTSSGNTLLQMAIMTGITEIVKLLLNRGANVNETNAEGKDAVRIAQEQAEQAPDEDSKVKYEQMVQLLQEKQ